MSKKIADYLHFYLNCQVMTPKGEGKFITINLLDQIGCGMNPGYQEFLPKEIKPILRPLDDMTEEEACEMWGLLEWNENISKEKRASKIIEEFECQGDDYGGSTNESWKYLLVILPYLLKHSFDLFGLIELGLAIPKQTQSPDK